MWGSQILEIFRDLESNNELSLKEISDKYKISQRNLRYEIEKINSYLNEKNKTELNINRGVISHGDWKDIINFLEDEKIFYTLSSEEREFYIILQFLLKREGNQKKLAQDLDISITTIKVHFREIKKKLENFNLQLKIIPKKGLELFGDEEQLRGYYLKIHNKIMKNNFKYLQNIIEKEIDGKINSEGIKRFINYCQKLMGIIISDEAYKIIVNYLKIALYMNIKNCPLKNIKNEKFLSETKEFKCIIRASSILEEWYGIDLNEIEYLKITDYFLGSNTYNIKYSYYENWVEIEILLKEIIVDFNGYIEENILTDRLLLDGLLNHMKPTIYRIKNNISLENSIYKEVIESYPRYYNITKNVLRKFQEKMNVIFTEDEIAFMAIHFKAAVDRNRIKRKKHKVVLVCGSGYGTSKLLAQQLKQQYDIEVIDIIPKYLVEKIEENETIDFIFSTVNIDEKFLKIPLIKLKPLLTEEDKIKLESYGIQRNNKKISLSKLLDVIGDNCKIFQENNLIDNLKLNFGEYLQDDIFQEKNTIFDYIKPNRIILKENIISWKEAIEKAGEILLRENIINESYIRGSIKNIEEFGAYMILGPEVLFPHCRLDEKIKTGFSILTLKEPVYLPKGEKVSVIIMFSSKDNNEHMETFIKLVNLANEDNFLERVQKIKNSQEFMRLFKM
ncbi:MAG: BglG family transcription antiterminator [Cetobacterium sp.]|uniref:BglG family transcription antiterminator n=1 Tax=Cetobacterium sp. TaxID=2071632 RepID=UPI003F3C918E